VADDGEPRRELRTRIRYGFLEAGGKAVEETWDKSVFSLVMLGKMLTGEVSWRNLSGPVTIADYAGQSARLGLDYYLKFMALVSISLGVLNLLPIPVLDGGHLMYHMIEVVRRGPLSERAMEIGQQIGLSLLLALMAFAFFNDINRLLSG
jgi:regulator of sigma E protease